MSVAKNHPDWALAYILQDLTRNGRPALKRAYELASDPHLTVVRTETRDEAIAEALRKLRVYVAALEEVTVVATGKSASETSPAPNTDADASSKKDSHV